MLVVVEQHDVVERGELVTLGGFDVGRDGGARRFTLCRSPGSLVGLFAFRFNHSRAWPAGPTGCRSYREAEIYVPHARLRPA